jgi:REP element-mobilizing transposase RayT
MTYLITFPCYGSHMHGAPEGSVDRNHNRYGSPFAEADPERLASQVRLMDQPPYQLDQARREAALEGMADRCARHDWRMLAAHIRTNHVHIVIQGEDTPEFIMTQLKAAASQRLNELGFDHPARKRWARHGSTRWLFNEESVRRAIRYVVEGQGEAMATYTG